MHHLLQTLKREIDIIIHGQSFNFRIIKYIVIFLINFLLYKFYGWSGVIGFVVIGFILGIGLHIFVRWKTNGWRKSWGLFKTPYKTK